MLVTGSCSTASACRTVWSSMSSVWLMKVLMPSLNPRSVALPLVSLAMRAKISLSPADVLGNATESTLIPSVLNRSASTATLSGVVFSGSSNFPADRIMSLLMSLGAPICSMNVTYCGSMSVRLAGVRSLSWFSLSSCAIVSICVCAASSLGYSCGCVGVAPNWPTAMASFWDWSRIRDAAICANSMSVMCCNEASIATSIIP